MILFFVLIGCAQKPFVFKRKPNQCRQLSSLYKNEEGGVLSEQELIYKWNEAGNRLDFQMVGLDGKIKESYRIYNEQGFVIEEYSEEYGGQHTTREYDCSDESCWEKRVQIKLKAGTFTSNMETEYVWDGKTKKYSTSQKLDGPYDSVDSEGYILYNDYGYPVKEYHKAELGYQKINVEYDCADGWCKILSKESVHFVKGGVFPSLSDRSLPAFKEGVLAWWNSEDSLQEDILEYDWDENKQEWKTTASQGYRIYNNHGYVIESYSESGALKSWTINTYDCREEQ